MTSQDSPSAQPGATNIPHMAHLSTKLRIQQQKGNISNFRKDKWPNSSLDRNDQETHEKKYSILSYKGSGQRNARDPMSHPLGRLSSRTDSKVSKNVKKLAPLHTKLEKWKIQLLRKTLWQLLKRLNELINTANQLFPYPRELKCIFRHNFVHQCSWKHAVQLWGTKPHGWGNMNK